MDRALHGHSATRKEGGDKNQLSFRVGDHGLVNSMTCCASNIPSDVIGSQDWIYLAALVGSTKVKPLKHDIIRHLLKNMASGACLLIRSAHGIRELVYEAVEDLDELSSRCGATMVAEWHPEDDVLNSSIIIRKL